MLYLFYQIFHRWILFMDYVATSPNAAMESIGDTVRKNKNGAHLTPAAWADKLGPTDEFTPGYQWKHILKLLTGFLFPNQEAERRGIMLTGLSRGPAGCLRQDWTHGEGKGSGEQVRAMQWCRLFLNIGQPGIALVKIILHPSSTEVRS